MPTEFKNVYLTEALESIQAEKRVSIQEMDNHTEVLEGALRTKTDNLKEELEASVSLAMKVPVLKDVNAMKVADGLLDGDVVQLQGYNSAGDGLHHMRKLSTVDDGTGILLPSGLYANYVKDSRNADKLDKAIYDNEVPKINEEITTIKEELYSTLPIGTILAIGHNEIPLGFLLCDGRTINQSEYPELYRLYGSNIPDYTNMFLRGNAVGREIGSLQEDAIRNIEGNLRLTGAGSAGFYDTTYSDSPLFTHSTDTTSTQLSSQSGTGTTKRLIGFDASRVVPTSDENRPKNISVNYIIKATNVVNPSSVVDVAEELNRKMEQYKNDMLGELVAIAEAGNHYIDKNGMKIQWGSVSVSAGSGSKIFFPVAFNNTPAISLTLRDPSSWDVWCADLKSTEFTAKHSYANDTLLISWIAIGV